MLTNNKLLYVFPEMAFTAKVAETPKEDYYFVQAFHQINGDFMKDENLLFENLKKLFERIEEGTYTLVLPDFLFTDTIVNVPEIEDLKIAEHLRDQLLPRIEVSTFSHDTRTSILLQRKDNSKVQLSAFEKELIATIKLAIGNKEIKIDEIVPLSWILKAAVSLEPSLTIAQMGERLYLAEHYIGINQTVNAKLTDLEVIAETVKTLKGADPNLQTAYLLTSGLVEERLKKILLKTLPVQQLTEQNEEEAKVPSYLRQIIEVGARTLSLTDFPVPRFDLVVEETKTKPETVIQTEKVATEVITEELGVSEGVSEEVSVVEKKASVASSIDQDSDVIESKVQDIDDKLGEKSKKITENSTLIAQENEIEKETIKQSEISNLDENLSKPQSATAVFLPKKIVAEAAPVVAAAAQIKNEQSEQVSVAEKKTSVAPETVVDEPKSSSTTVETQKIQEKVAEQEKTEVSRSVESTTEIKTDAAPTEKVVKKKFALSFMNKDKKAPESKTEIAKTAEKKSENNDKITDINLVTKKKGRMGMFFKKLFLFILIFAITIIVGIVVGIGILLLSGKDVLKSEVSPTPEPTFLPTPEPIAEVPTATESTQPATPSIDEDEEVATTETKDDEEEIAIDKQKVLVVNATGVAGLAGKVKTALEKDGFKGIQTGNAKGKYEDAGTFVLMKERNSALIKLLEKASDKTLIYDEDYQTEDAAGTYDAVIVLNEE